MAFLSFSCLESYYYLFIYWVLDLSIIIQRDIYIEKEIKENDILKGIEFVYISCLNIADLLAGFLVLHTHCKMKKKNIKVKEMEIEDEKQQKKEKKKKKSNSSNKSNKERVIKKSVELIYNDNSIKNHRFIYLFLISLFEFIARCYNLFYLLLFKDLKLIRPAEINWLISVDTFARVFFSYLILKTKIYKHHKCSLILIIIGLFSMSVCAFEALAKEESACWPYFIFIIIRYILLPLEDVINKILLTNEFLLPHYLMFYRGIFNFFMVIILGLSVIIPGFVEFVYFSQFTTESQIIIQILMKIIFTIFSFFKAFFLLRVLDIFSPQHVAFLNTAITLYNLFKCRIKSGEDILLITVDAFFLIVIIFGTLIFNEMIIINSCGLNKNTKKGFLIKEKQEFQDIKSSNNSISDDDNSENEDKEEEEENKEITN